jgi:4'-phosphopantetheinyl transferase
MSGMPGRAGPGAGAVDCLVRWARPVDLPWMRELLDQSERERYARFRAPADRARFVTGRALARLTLARVTGVAPARLAFTTVCRHCAGPHGKPRLADHPVGFSLSHSGDRVVIALAEGVEVGVDVERTGASLDRLAAKLLSEAERDAIAALPPPRRRHALGVYWSRKEAVLKASGHGLALPFPSLTVSPPGAPPAVLAWDSGPRGQPVRLADLDRPPGYTAALAALTDGPLRVVEEAGLA